MDNSGNRNGKENTVYWSAINAARYTLYGTDNYVFYSGPNTEANLVGKINHYISAFTLRAYSNNSPDSPFIDIKYVPKIMDTTPSEPSG